MVTLTQCCEVIDGQNTAAILSEDKVEDGKEDEYQTNDMLNVTIVV